MDESLKELFSPVRKPANGFQWEPNHYQRTMGVIPKESEHFVATQGGKGVRKPPEFNVTKPPFGLDFDRFELADDEVAQGYKVGGPKEFRLFRVALLKNDRENDHLFPVKVIGIPELIQEEELAEAFRQFGKVGNVYVPRDGLTRKSVAPFAVVRFIDKCDADRALIHGKLYIKSEFGGPEPYLLTIAPNPSQESTFTMNTGVHGMTNRIIDSMIATQEQNDAALECVTQNITLDECFSRSGNPWVSKRELKILEPHADREVMDMHTIKIENLNIYIHPNEIRSLFNDMNLHIGDVYCPRPQHVHLRLKDGRYNEGFAFLRFKDPRDMKKAMESITKGLITFSGQTITGEVWKPYQWPTQKTRRYC